MQRRRVVLFLRSLDNDYQQRLREDALTAAQGAGFDIEVQAAHNDAAKQTEQIATTLAGPHAAEIAAILVSAVRDEELAHLAREAGSAGVGWVLLNREASYLGPVRDAFAGLPIFSVTPDQAQIGSLQAAQVKALLPAGGEVLCATGPAKTSSARLRLEGLRAALAGGDVAFTLSEIEADWTSEGARLAVERWVDGRGPGSKLPSIVVAQNDEMALGVRQALRDVSVRRGEPGWAQIPITGCDGSPSFGQRLVREKRLAATVELPPATGSALEWLARARDADERPPLHVTLPVASFPDTEALQRR